MSITTTTRVKALLGIPAGITFHDTALGYAVDFANSRVLRALGQATLSVHTVQEYPEVYMAGQAMVQLRRAPVVQLVAVSNDDSLLTTDDYRLDADAGALRLKRGAGWWSEEREGCAVMYSYGFTSSTLPDEVLGATEAIAAAAFNRRRNAGMNQRQGGGVTYQLSDRDLPPEAMAVLARYEDAHR